MIHNLSDLLHQLKRADADPNIALLCINDDLPEFRLTYADEILRDWFERKWPDKMECEL